VDDSSGIGGPGIGSTVGNYQVGSRNEVKGRWVRIPDSYQQGSSAGTWYQQEGNRWYPEDPIPSS